MKKAVTAALVFALGALLYGQADSGSFEVRNNGSSRIMISRYLGDNKVVPNFDYFFPPGQQGIPVTSIGYRAFWFKNIERVTIPPTVRSIEAGAFERNNLTRLMVPGSVRTIGEWAFRSNELTNVTLEEGIAAIGAGAFEENGLGSVTIPNTVRSIGDWAFHNNVLTNVSISKRARSIGTGAFANNKLTAIVIPGSVREIGDQAFANAGDSSRMNNRITRVTIGNNVRLGLNSIDDGSFYFAYNREGKRAGIYVKAGNTWKLERAQNNFTGGWR